MEKTTTTDKPNICEKGIGKFKTFNIGITEITTDDNETQYECYSFTAKDPCLTDILPRIVDMELDLTEEETAVITAECSTATESQLIASLVRARYSADDVEAIILNQDDGDETHEEEYNTLQAWRKKVKTIARQFV